MKKEEGHRLFPDERHFLEWIERLADEGSFRADSFARDAGEKLPASLNGLGSVLSLLYRAACCDWGCRGEDHQVEWLTGRVVNLAMAAYRLMRAGFYDESLTLTRGIGEVANLLWLFAFEDGALKTWRHSDRAARLKNFGPSAVRKRLRDLPDVSAPIDDERYRRLCEVGTHPVPGFAPGHYTGTGRPILGVLLQPVGIYVSVTELCFAVAACAIPLSGLLGLKKKLAPTLMTKALALVQNLGAFSVLNYDELLLEAMNDRGQSDKH